MKVVRFVVLILFAVSGAAHGKAPHHGPYPSQGSGAGATHCGPQHGSGFGGMSTLDGGYLPGPHIPTSPSLSSVACDPVWAGDPVSPWRLSAGALLMTRDDENFQPFSYDSANESIQLTDSRDANIDFASGVEMRIGSQAWELVYWGVYPGEQSTVTTGDHVNGNLNGILNWDQLDYNGNSADAFIDNAQAHAVFRENHFHNVEMNLLRLGSSCGKECGLKTEWVFGARCLLFSDHLTFASDTVDRVFTGAADELTYSIDTDNHLFGGQFGGLAHYRATSCLSFDFGAKFGVYSNLIDHRSRIGGAAGTATINNGPFEGQEFLADGVATRISLLGELNAGVTWRLRCHAEATLGYRAVGVTGVALPTNQIYPDLRGINDVRMVDTNGSLILHGAYARLGWEY